MTFVGKPDGRDHLEDLRRDEQMRTVFVFKQEKVFGSCEYGKEPSSLKKFG